MCCDAVADAELVLIGELTFHFLLGASVPHDFVEFCDSCTSSFKINEIFLNARMRHIEKRLTRFNVVWLVIVFHYCTDIYRCESMNASDKSRLTHYE